MAFGGRELRLILSIQSYGTSNIARLRRDLVQLHTAAEAANAKQMAQARVARQVARVSAAEQDLRNIRAGVPFYEARNKAMMQWGRANASVISTQARQLDNARRLFDIETKRQVMTRKLAQARPLGLSDIQITELKRGLESLTMQEAVLAKSSQALTSSLAAQQTQLHAADVAYKELIKTKGAMHAETLAAKQALDMETASLERLTLAEKQAAMAAKALPIQQLEHTARQVAHVGRTMQFAGLIAAAGFGLAAGSFAEFTERASLAATQMRDIGAPIAQTVQRSKELQDRILDLGMQFPASATEMSEAAYEIFSSMNIVRNGVVDTAKGFSLLEKANKAAVAGGVELKEATDAMIVVLNNFDPNLNRSTELLNQMFSVVRFGKMRLSDLGGAMKHLAPIAKTVGLEFSDVGSAFATLTILSGDMETASTGLARAIELLRLPAFRKGLEAWGAPITDATGKLIPLNQIIEKLITRFPEMATGQKAVIETLIQISKASGMTKAGIQGTVQGRRAIAGLVTAYELYGNILQNVTRNKKEFDDAFAARIQDPGVQWQIFLRQMQTLILVIGRAALPVFLALGERIAKFIQWFKDLNPAIRDSVIKIAAFAAIFALFGGTLINVVGSIVALKLNMKLLSLATEETTGRFAALRMVMGTIGFLALGVIISEVFSLRDAVIVMTAAWLIWKVRAIQSIVAVVGAIITGSLAAGTAIRQGLIRSGIGLLIVAFSIAAEIIIMKWDQVKKKIAGTVSWIRGILGHIPRFAGSGMDDWLAGVERWGNAVDGTGKKVSESSKLMAQYNKILKGFIGKDFLAAQEAFANSFNPDTSGLNDAASLAKKRTQEVAQAHENMARKIDDAVDNLTQIYQRFQDANKQAFGSDLFGGSFLVDMFTNLNSQLRQFGITIPVPFDILQQDMEQRLMFFKRWRESLNKLLARGAPLEFVQDLQAMGPEAGLPIAEGLLQGGKKGFKDLLKTWKQGQKLIRKASKADMDRQLDDWEKHGKNIAWQIINGIMSEPAQAKLRAGFKTYVVDTFGSILRTEMAKEVEDAMTQAILEGQAAAAAAAAAMPKGAKPPPIPTIPEMNIPQTQAALRSTRRELGNLKTRMITETLAGMKPTEKQLARLTALFEREKKLERHLARERELMSIRKQLRRGREAGREMITITYQGDTVTVKADGATPVAVLRALNKAAHRKKTRRRGRPHARH